MITLKKNNTPTKPGNYIGSEEEAFGAIGVWVGFDGEGGLGFTDNEGRKRNVTEYEMWSDVLGPITFEEQEMQKPEAPQRLRQGWFEKDGQVHRVVDLDDGSGAPMVVVPEAKGMGGDADYFSREDFESRGIEIHWHDEPDAGVRSVTGTLRHHQTSNNNWYVFHPECDVEIPEKTPVTITYPSPAEREIEPGQPWKVRCCNNQEFRVVAKITTGGREPTASLIDKNYVQYDPSGEPMTCAELQAWLNSHAEYVGGGE